MEITTRLFKYSTLVKYSAVVGCNDMYHTYAHTVLMKRINVNNVVTNFNSHITLVMRIKYFACISKESVFILYRFVTLILLIYHIYIYI